MDVFSLVATLQLQADSFFSGLTAAGKALVDFAADSVRTGSEFDYTMSGVRAVMGEFSGDINGLIKQADEMGLSYVRGANDAETAFNILRSKALDSSKQTRYTAEETAEALHYMGMAGWEYGEALAALDGVMQLAAAGNVSVGRTSDIVTDALTAFQQPASEAGHLVDVMATAAAKSNTNVNMLGESFKYAAPLAGALGYSFEDVGLALGLMADAGIKSGRAGRAVNNILARLANSPKKVAAEMQEYGISLSDAEGNMLSFRGVMERLREEMGNLAGSGVETKAFADYVEELFEKNTDVKKLGEDYLPNLVNNLREGKTTAIEAFTQLSQDLGNAFTEDMQKGFLNSANVLVRNGYEEVLRVADILGGKQALPALLALITASEEDFNSLASALDNSAGAGERMQKTMLENLKGDLYLFNSAADVARVAISDKLTPTIREFVQYGTTGITEVTDAFKKGGVEALPDAIEKFMAGAAELIDKHAPEIQAAGTALVKVLSAGIKIAWPYVESVLGFLWDNAKPFIIRIINETSDIVVSTALEAFKTPLQGIADKLRGNVLFGGIADLIDGLYKDGSEKPGSYNMRPESEGLGELTAKEAADYVYRKYSAGLTEQWQKADVYAAVDEAFKAGKTSVDEFEQYLQEKGFKVSVDTTEAEQGLKSMEKLLTEATQKEYTFKLNIPNIFGGYTGADSQGISDARSMSGGTILRGATMFGWDAQGIPHIGGGEGPEAVVGVNSLDRMIQNSVANAVSGIVSGLNTLVAGGRNQQPAQLVLDTGVLVAAIAPSLDTEMSRITNWRHGGDR